MSAEWVVAVCAVLTLMAGIVGILIRSNSREIKMASEISKIQSRLDSEVSAIQVSISVISETVKSMKVDVWGAVRDMNDGVHRLDMEIEKMKTILDMNGGDRK